MTITLNISPELERHLVEESQKVGLSVDEYTAKLLEESISRKEKTAKAIAVLQSWIDEEDDGEQKETGEYLIRVLDEDRLSDRKLFPEELKGISW